MNVGDRSNGHDDVCIVVEKAMPFRDPVDTDPEVLPKDGGVVDGRDPAAERLFHKRPVEVATLQSVDYDGVGMKRCGIRHVQAPPLILLSGYFRNGTLKKLQPVLAPIQFASIDIGGRSENAAALRLCQIVFPRRADFRR